MRVKKPASTVARPAMAALAKRMGTAATQKALVRMPHIPRTRPTRATGTLRTRRRTVRKRQYSRGSTARLGRLLPACLRAATQRCMEDCRKALVRVQAVPEAAARAKTLTMSPRAKPRSETANVMAWDSGKRKTRMPAGRLTTSRTVESRGELAAKSAYLPSIKGLTKLVPLCV